MLCYVIGEIQHITFFTLIYYTFTTLALTRFHASQKTRSDKIPGKLKQNKRSQPHFDGLIHTHTPAFAYATATSASRLMLASLSSVPSSCNMPGKINNRLSICHTLKTRVIAPYYN